MKRVLRVTLEYVEEWDPKDNDENEKSYEDYTFDDWCDSDWDNVGRPLDRLIDEGWEITRKKVIKE